MSNFSLQIQDLCFAYGPRQILRCVSFAIYAGESVGLSGANGSGKTTLFRCITGLEKADSGAIILNGQQMCVEKDFQGLRRCVGFSLQEAEDQLIFPTVLEDVSFGPLNIGCSETEAQAQATAVLNQLGLAGYEERLCHELSGGQQKLVALAGVLAMRPALLLLDEPFNALDANATKRVMEVIANLDCAKIIVAHDQTMLRQLCQRQLKLEQGKIVD